MAICQICHNYLWVVAAIVLVICVVRKGLLDFGGFSEYVGPCQGPEFSEEVGP